jgi:hypothetical protein
MIYSEARHAHDKPEAGALSLSGIDRSRVERRVTLGYRRRLFRNRGCAGGSNNTQIRSAHKPLDHMDCIAIHDALGIGQNRRQKSLFDTDVCDAIHIRSLSDSRPIYCAGGIMAQIRRFSR